MMCSDQFLSASGSVCRITPAFKQLLPIFLRLRNIWLNFCLCNPSSKQYDEVYLATREVVISSACASEIEQISKQLHVPACSHQATWAQSNSSDQKNLNSNLEKENYHICTPRLGKLPCSDYWLVTKPRALTIKTRLNIKIQYIGFRVLSK